MGAVSTASEGQARRVNVRFISERNLNRLIFGLSVPPINSLLRAFYGVGWSKIIAKRYGWPACAVINSVAGRSGLPRSFFLDALAEYRDPVKSAAWERERRAAFERELAADKARRAACARWFELLLNGGAQLPTVNRWRAWKSGRVENFLGKADL